VISRSRDSTPGDGLPAPTRTPRRPLLVVDSGGAEPRRAQAVQREAARRGHAIIRLRPGEHFGALERAIDACGADALICFASDRQASIALLAAGRALPLVCVPAGEHDLFARDLGVALDDAPRALDALESGHHTRVDIAEVNGIAFLNYVGVGARFRPQPRSPRGRFAASPAAASATASPAPRLRWFGAEPRELASTLVVSNNRYGLTPIGLGRRTSLHAGILGVGVIAPRRAALGAARTAWREWWARTLLLDGESTVAAEVDGRAVALEPPLRFRVLPGALRVLAPGPA